MSDVYWICPHDDCRRQVKEPEVDGVHWGMSWCEYCKAWVVPVPLMEMRKEGH